MIEIRSAEEKDMTRVKELQEEVFGYSFSDKKLKRHLDDIFLVALVDKEIAGFSIFEKEGVGVSIAVSKQKREKGVGRRLMTWTEKKLSAAGVRKMRLHSRENNPFLEFFRELGYTKKAVVPHYYKDGSNALFMEKELH